MDGCVVVNFCAKFSVRNFGRVVKALALGASLARGTGSNPVGCKRPFNLVDLRHLHLPAAPRVGLAAADLSCSTYTSAGTSGRGVQTDEQVPLRTESFCDDVRLKVSPLTLGAAILLN
jgi:hypothetical protein